MDSPLVQKSSVAAAEIDQPKLADVLQMNQGVPARHLRRIQRDRVRGDPPEGTTSLDRMTSAIGCFQPGTFLWGYVHVKNSTKK